MNKDDCSYKFRFYIMIEDIEMISIIILYKNVNNKSSNGGYDDGKVMMSVVTRTHTA